MAETSKQREKFLAELANLRHDSTSKRAFLDRWPTFIPQSFLADSPLSRTALEDNERLSQGAFRLPTTASDIEEYSLGHLDELAHMLRRAWTEPTVYRRQYFAHEVSRRFARMYFADPTEHPPRSPFELAMAHFSTVIQRARRCEYSGCPMPYYLASNQKPRRYCAQEWKTATGEKTTCAREVKIERGLKWWNSNKDDQLERRKLERRKLARRARLFGDKQQGRSNGK